MEQPPNEPQISCRPSAQRPHKPTLRNARLERCAGASPRSGPAWQLQLLVKAVLHCEARRSVPFPLELAALLECRFSSEVARITAHPA